jgi:SAM-dependent methyltransferase
MIWPYDLTAEFYDEDMGRNNDGRDIAWYVALARAAAPGPILELGCGTGRVTLPLAQTGRSIVAADYSMPMLRVLGQKAAAAHLSERIEPLAMDMGRWSLAGRFAAIFCPFSAFTYLVDDDDRARMLAGVRACLAHGGVFALDVFVPDARLNALNDGARIDDYQRALPERWRPATTLTRSKRLTRDVRPGVRPAVNRIARHYRFLDAQGEVLREVDTESLQRPYAPEDLLSTLTAAGFADLQACGDFDAARVAAGPMRTIAVTAHAGRQ